jgi:spermidine/putrescine transport system substrate-binding protein
LRYVLPSNGGIWFDNMAIPRKAPHRDAALAFIDYVLEGKVGAQIPRVYGYSTPDRAALDELERTDASFAANAVTNPPRDALQGLLLTKDVGGEASDRFDAAWREVRG